jgi:hypothetical protein
VSPIGRWGQGACTATSTTTATTTSTSRTSVPNRLYRNDGRGHFEDVAGAAGVSAGGWSTGCAFADYDGDGRLDLFVAGYIALDLERLPPSPSSAGARPDAAARPENKTPGTQAPYRPGMTHCEYRTVPAMCGPKGLKGATDHLFRNNGDGTFAETSQKAGVADAAGLYGIGVAFFDFDDDGRLDLFVANDSCSNYLYRNRGDGTFQDVSYASGAAFNEAGQEQSYMGVAVGDYDRDGRLDLHVTTFENDANILYHNDGGGLFSEATYPAGVGTPSVPFVGWGTNFLDYDNDGWLDLFVANGHVYPGWTASTGTPRTSSACCSSATCAEGSSRRSAAAAATASPWRAACAAPRRRTSTTTATSTSSRTRSRASRSCCATTAATARATG